MDLSVIYDSLMPKSSLVRKMILAGISAFLFVNIFQNIWKILGILLAIIAAGIVFCTQTNYCANVSLSSIKEKIVNEEYFTKIKNLVSKELTQAVNYAEKSSVPKIRDIKRNVYAL